MKAIDIHLNLIIEGDHSEFFSDFNDLCRKYAVLKDGDADFVYTYDIQSYERENDEES